jgi:hypothetical protein
MLVVASSCGFMRVPEGLVIPRFSGFLRVSVATQSEPKTWNKNPNEIMGLLVDFSPQAGLLNFFGTAFI